MLRRTFLQFALAALALPAAAQSGLRGHFRTRQADGFTIVDLELENDSSQTQDILLWVGGRPATELTAGSHQPLPPETAREPFTNRAGPRHVWQPLPPQQRLFAGSYRFAGGPTTFTARIRTGTGTVEVTST